MSGALCGPACGYCGRCSAVWEREDEDLDRTDDDYPTCDFCEAPTGEDRILTTAGIFCSAACFDEAQDGDVPDVPDNLKGVK